MRCGEVRGEPVKSMRYVVMMRHGLEVMSQEASVLSIKKWAETYEGKMKTEDSDVLLSEKPFTRLSALATGTL
jgi:hypothetical protein